jgi:hypothetical protein
MPMLEWVEAWKAVVVGKVRSIPSWVIVLATAAVVGAVSAVVSVTGLARLQNDTRTALEVPVREGGADE